MIIATTLGAIKNTQETTPVLIIENEIFIGDEPMKYVDELNWSDLNSFLGL